MTSIDDLTNPALAARPEPQRDRYGRYLIPHPDRPDGKPIPWTRATTWASSVADTWGLDQWRNRMTALGLAMRPDLYAQVATVTDPDHPDAKRLLNTTVTAAQEHAGSRVRANLGTALHSFAEAVDTGRTITIPAPFDRDVAAYRATMDAAGIVVDPTMVERIVVVPELGVAGTLDRGITGRSGRKRIADLKTGKNLSFSWGEIAIQLALYAHGTAIWDVETQAFLPMPTVDLDQALVMHLPAGEARCDLYLVDIAAGWEMAQVCGTVREWRKRKDLATLAYKDATEPDPVAASEPTGVHGSTPTGSEPAATGHPAPPEAPVAAAPTTRREWLLNRRNAFDPAAVELLKANWPPGVPGLLGDHQHTDDELAQVETAINLVDKLTGAPFPDPAPEPPAIPHGDTRRTDLMARLQQMPPDLVASFVAQAYQEHKVPKLSGLDAMSATDLVTAISIVGDLEEATVERQTRLCELLAVVEPAGVTEQRILDTLGIADLDQACAWHLVAFEHLAAAVAAGVNPFEPAPEFLKQHGGARALIAAAKPVAEAVHLDRPKAAADVLASPVLVAAVATNPTPTAA